MTEKEAIEFSEKSDAADPLRGYRDKFHIPLSPEGKETIYLTGNSLGAQPKKTREYVMEELDAWEKMGVEGHFHAKHPWMPYHEFLTESMAKIVGAKPSEVVVMNSLTVNLHLMMVSFYRPTKTRYKILIEGDAFPSDKYAVRSQAAFHGFDPDDAVIELRSENDSPVISTEQILETIRKEKDSLALILLGGVNYYTGQVFEMEKITKAGHDAGAIVGFDLAHAAGNVILQLHDWNVDFACWCSYKYLNSGPGSAGSLFVHERFANDSSLPRFSGWWGHDKQTRFQMPGKFIPISGAEGWQLSNAPILSMACMRASLEIFDAAGMNALRKKAEQLTDFLFNLLKPLESSAGIKIITPSDPTLRGCQLSLLTGSNGRALFQRLSDLNIICDWREPNVIRIAPVPLYNTFGDALAFAKGLSGSI